ncbi:MAG: hypothetical protein ACT4O9_04095 [Blastocatellia bacterium]
MRKAERGIDSPRSAFFIWYQSYPVIVADSVSPKAETLPSRIRQRSR